MSPSTTVCLILSVDSYYDVDGRYQVRELAFQYPSKEEPSVVHFQVAIPSTVQRNPTTRSVYRMVHGLPWREGFLEQDQYRITLSHLYEGARTEQRPHVAIWGDNALMMELVNLRIPFIDLQQRGCPEFHGPFPFDCGHHKWNKSCAMSLVSYYRQWTMNSQ